MAEEIKLRLEGYKRKDGVQIPALRFFSTCFHNLRTFPLVTHDKRQPEKSIRMVKTIVLMKQDMHVYLDHISQQDLKKMVGSLRKMIMKI